MPVLKYIKSCVKQRIPILKWAPKYNTKKFVSDVIAGTTVGLTVMPQALAYATLAGLEPQYGLYSAFVGCFVYAIFGSIKDITIGPTALMALMTYQQIADKNTDYAVLLCFLTGLVQLLMAILHLGVLIDFISLPVTVGFTSATSFIIVASQLKSLLGLKNIKSSTFISTIRNVFKHINETNFPDLILGIICIIILILLRKLKDIKIKKSKKYLNNILWLISISRNALIVIISSIIAYIYDNNNGNGSSSSPFQLTGQVKSGLPKLKLPPFKSNLNNNTIFINEMINDLGSSIILVPIIGVLGNVAIAKAFSYGTLIDATQELLTLSICNIIGSLFSSMPITGSFSRSAVNHASGVETPFGGIITGIMVILALSFLTPYFALIPKTSLAAVIITAVIFMIEYEVIKPMWKCSKKDLFSTFATFIISLIIGVEYGILIGVAINIIFLLYPSARPIINIDKLKTPSGKEFIIITPGNSLYFPAVDFIKNSIAKASIKNLPIVLDCRYILGADFTAAKGMHSLINEFYIKKQPLYFLNTCKEVVNIFQEVINRDFKYFNKIEELEITIDNELADEEAKLL